ncbi:ammonium transporter [Tepidibacillus infernus]|uniref:Ammonium transporter n=1 Tax=Tepidibacillus decaturensis TaxID=1413211 RepID=A0A135L2X8_9BACI|nr:MULTISPECIES: ammonium transporter [Tepidibacillus]KXG43203.1 ammonium transporter [Tepidibacillus decaturensis]GBF10938.1 ammonia channel precursor [Tepidibacillus sp. HK-1]
MENLTISLDTLLVFISTTLVLIMHAGFIMVEVGFNRAKNALNITMKNFLTIALGPLAFYLIGFGLTFGEDFNGFLGTTGFLMKNISVDLSIPLAAFFSFQAVFAATSATIVSGAVAERIKFSAYVMFSVLLVAIVYPIVGHWAWGGGWLSKLGFIDFAGSTVVHSVGGWAALVGASILGPRIGKYEDDKVHAIPGHNIPLGALGVIILWFGWFGFNTGSALTASDARIPDIFTVTLLGASAAVLATMIFTSIRYKKVDVSLTLNAALIGLVSITAGAASFSPLGSVIVGVISGIILVFAVEFLDYVKIDDPVGAFPVHGIGGIFGTLAVGLFATDGGLFYGGGFKLLAVQALGVTTVALWTISTSFIIFKVIEKTIGLRVSEQVEKEGLDITEHGSYAYSTLFLRDQIPVINNK